MDERLRKVEEKSDLILERLHSIDKTLIVQAEHLKEHMRRTRVNEKTLQAFKQHVEADLKPIKMHVHGMNYMLKAVGVLALLLSVAFTAMKTYDWLKEPPPQGDSSNAQMPKVRSLRGKTAK